MKYKIQLILLAIFMISAVNAEDNTTLEGHDLTNFDCTLENSTTDVSDVDVSSNDSNSQKTDIGENNVTSIIASDLTKYYKNDTQFTAKFLNFDGTALKNTEILFNIIGKNYTLATDNNGIATLDIKPNSW